MVSYNGKKGSIGYSPIQSMNEFSFQTIREGSNLDVSWISVEFRQSGSLLVAMHRRSKIVEWNLLVFASQT